MTGREIYVSVFLFIVEAEGPFQTGNLPTEMTTATILSVVAS